MRGLIYRIHSLSVLRGELYTLQGAVRLAASRAAALLHLMPTPPCNSFPRSSPAPAPSCRSLFLDYFIGLVDDWGPLGYVAYAVVYAGLELLAVPAIPLTMTAGAIFGLLPGTAVVSVAATAACTGAFLVARYVARDKVGNCTARALWVVRYCGGSVGREGLPCVGEGSGLPACPVCRPSCLRAASQPSRVVPSLPSLNKTRR